MIENFRRCTRYLFSASTNIMKYMSLGGIIFTFLMIPFVQPMYVRDNIFSLFMSAAVLIVPPACLSFAVESSLLNKMTACFSHTKFYHKRYIPFVNAALLLTVALLNMLFSAVCYKLIPDYDMTALVTSFNNTVLFSVVSAMINIAIALTSITQNSVFAIAGGLVVGIGPIYAYPVSEWFVSTVSLSAGEAVICELAVAILLYLALSGLFTHCFNKDIITRSLKGMPKNANDAMTAEHC